MYNSRKWRQNCSDSGWLEIWRGEDGFIKEPEEDFIIGRLFWLWRCFTNYACFLIHRIVHFFWLYHMACMILIPHQGLNLGPQQWKCGVLITGLPENSCGDGLVAKSDSYDPMGYSLPGSSVHGIFQARIIGEGCHFLLQEIFLTQGANPHLLCLPHWQASSLPLTPPGKHCIMGYNL